MFAIPSVFQKFKFFVLVLFKNCLQNFLRFSSCINFVLVQILSLPTYIAWNQGSPLSNSFCDSYVVSRKTDVRTAKLYFYAGFFLLPFVWLVNWFYFRKVLQYPETDADIKYYARTSLTFFFVFLAAWVTWIILFYSMESKWPDWMFLTQAPNEEI